jgi:tetratricopeptide (TPR) repeat protein
MLDRIPGRRVWSTFVCLAVLALPVPSSSQEPSSDAERRYQQAFEAMRADLANPERSFEFVQAAVAVGDQRGAIAALERILQIDPSLANIQLELGVLYLGVGAHDLAAIHLRQALAAPDVPDPVRSRAEVLLGRAERATTPHIFTGRLYTAGHYDSNANAAPASRLVRVGGQDGLLQEGATGRQDFSVVLGGSLQYRYVTPSQAGHELEVNLNTYNRWYDKSDEINVNTVALDAGPRFFLGPSDNLDISLRPFVSASYVFLAEDDFLRTLGGGITLQKFFSAAWLGTLTFEAEDQRFYNSPSRQTSSDRSGPFFALTGKLDYQLQSTTLLSATANVARRDARESFESFVEGAFTMSVTQTYPPPFKLTALP